MEIKVAIIGGGIAGLSIARDLALRGFRITIFDKRKIGNGTTTQCAGMLHSGARYVTKDIKTAKLCFNWNKIIRKIVPQAVGKRGAFYVRYIKDDPEYEERFINGCKEIGIPLRKISGPKARMLEPRLGSNVSHVFKTPDVVIDTFSLIYSYLYDLRKMGVKVLEETNIKRASLESEKWKIDTNKGSFIFDFVINSTGDGLAIVGKIFGADIETSYIYGSMALFERRLSSRIITRCAPNAIGDVIVPGVDLTLIGSTWHERGRPSKVSITKKDEKEIKRTASKMLPLVNKQRLISCLTSVRTHLKDLSYKSLFGSKRDYIILDHEATHGIVNLISVLPGKMTIARYVAEQVGDIVCRKFNIGKKSRTANILIEKPKIVPRKFKFYLE